MKKDTKKTIEVLKRIYNNPNLYGCCGETADAFKHAIEALGELDRLKKWLDQDSDAQYEVKIFLDGRIKGLEQKIEKLNKTLEFYKGTFEDFEAGLSMIVTCEHYHGLERGVEKLKKVIDDLRGCGLLNPINPSLTRTRRGI